MRVKELVAPYLEIDNEGIHIFKTSFSDGKYETKYLYEGSKYSMPIMVGMFPVKRYYIDKGELHIDVSLT